MKHEVFISYSSKNATVAQAVCHKIEEQGIRCWMAPRNILPGASYADVIDEAIKECKVFVLIFSHYSSISPWVKSELNLAFEEQVHIIPFRIEDIPLEGANRLILNQTHWIDAYPIYESKLEDLVHSVSVVLGKQTEVSFVGIENDSKKKTCFRRILLCLMTLLVIGGFLFYAMRASRTFSYDNRGLIIKNIYGLTQKQAEALQSILDNMVAIEGGTFVMGNTEKGERYRVEQDNYSDIQHQVVLDDFYISRIELTQKQWMAFMDIGDFAIQLGELQPMDNLSWEASWAFVEHLSALTGLSFSLPTEAQWEYVAKGGNLSENYIYSGSDNVEDVGWVSSFDGVVHKGGLLEPNELGIYDLTGNVAEWCLDYYSDYFSNTQHNPRGPKTGKMKIFRGGSVDSEIYESKNTVRNWFYPSYTRKNTGLRLVINNFIK